MRAIEISYVVIGRNEEKRLRQCLQAILDQTTSATREVFYVDSRSTDRSVEIARELGVDVLVVEDPKPNAAKGRNLGWRHATGELIQFVDGDAVLTADWAEHGIRAMASDPKIGAVFGWWDEEHPEQSLYNRFADIDWPRGDGEVGSFGGIAMLRREALERAGGFPEDVLSGEEPVLAQAMRRDGYRFVQLPVPMASHDIDTHDFKTYWKRSVATGLSLAEQAANAEPGDTFASHKITKNGTFVVGLAGLLILGFLVSRWFWAATAALLVLDLLRIAWKNRARAGSFGAALAYAAHVRFLALPQTVGYPEDLGALAPPARQARRSLIRMFHHVVLFRLEKDVTLDRVRAARESLAALVETLPGVHQFAVTDNLADANRGYTLALFSAFEDRSACNIFTRHPEYRRVWTELLEPVIAERIVAEGEG